MTTGISKEKLEGVIKELQKDIPKERLEQMKEDDIKTKEFAEQVKKELGKKEIDKFRIEMGETYEMIIEILREFCDLREEYYVLTALWVIGTYLHDAFSTFPYLFANAMRGSGKTRFLKLVANLSYEGELIGSPTEAVLFRIPKGHTLCIDEFEGVMRKGNEGVRELLNACYKKGMKIRRIKKVKTPEGSEMQVEEFEPYKPICLANIYGMEEVLGDRCITMILEKSERKDIMRLVEDFNNYTKLHCVKKRFTQGLVLLVSLFRENQYIIKWNSYIKYKYTNYTNNINNTNYTPPPKEDLDMFNKIDDTGINGRNLELFLPLMIIGHFIGEDAFNTILEIASKLTKEKKGEEMVESRDVALIDWVSQQTFETGFISVKLLTKRFREYLGDKEFHEEAWINAKWAGRALKRLNLIIEKRRVRDGNEVRLDINKAKKKLAVFKPDD